MCRFHTLEESSLRSSDSDQGEIVAICLITMVRSKGKKALSTFLLQYSTPTAFPYVVLHIAGVVGQVCLLHSIKH